MKSIQRNHQKKLLTWFSKNKRALPWRKTKNPYSVWISEVMLQQTTCTAVIPYYKKFIKKFPTLKDLAKAQEKDIFSIWTGLGYYRRAQNLLKSAKQIHKLKTFPTSYEELLKLPGFGAYTSRAVSSLSFNKPVGVLDGNVIRFLSRFHGLHLKWWASAHRNFLQEISDSWVQNQESSQVNQALMELGSLVCTPKKPICFLCPLQKYCVAFSKNKISLLPLTKPRKELELWHWKPYKIKNKNNLAYVINNYLPFFKKQMIFPGVIKKLKQKPKSYHFSHSITHYKIYVTVQPKKIIKKASFHWFNSKQITKHNPSSLIKKILNTS